MQKELFQTDQYQSIPHGTSFLKANIFALVYPLPLVIMYVIGYFAYRLGTGQEVFVTSELLDNSLIWLVLFYALLLVAVIIHELTHALVFLRHSENGWKSVKFGIKSLTPYCHCEEVISLNAYRHACLAPLWSLCLPLVLISLFVGNSLFFLITLTMIFGSGCDLWIVFVTRKYNGKTTYAWDMIDEIGCEVYVPKNTEQSIENPQ